VSASPSIVIATGGTAGHVMPGLAVAEHLRELLPQHRIVFAGAEQGLERRLVPAAGFPLRLLPSAPLAREPWSGKVKGLLNLARATARARQLLREEDAAVVFGTGGYAAAPPLLAARSLAIPAAILECNATPGIANRWLARWVDRAFLGCAEALAELPSARAVVTGNPLRGEICRLAGESRRTPSTADPLRILVLGGSGGSPFLNRSAPVLAAHLARRRSVEVRHQAGDAECAPIGAAYVAASVPALVRAYVDDIAADYRWADFAVACAGAGTLAELCAAGLPALLVPLAAAAENHQEANARRFAAAGAGWWTAERDFEGGREAERVAGLAGDAGAWAAASAAARSLARSGAAAEVAAELVRLASPEYGSPI